MRRRTIMISESIDDRVLSIQSQLMNKHKRSFSTSIVINGLIQYALKQKPSVDVIEKSISDVKRSGS